MDNLVINNHTREIQIVHVHGTYKFYDCANLENEITEVAGQSGTVSSARLLDTFLIDQAPIIVGYSGWENDVIMKCLRERISYPTPLQYIWVCHSINNYENLPQWLKMSNSIIFVVPNSSDADCDNSDYIQEFTEKATESVIDATKFFKRLVYELKVPTSTILSNPYQYFSKAISELLPENEDVLHLRHWTQRLKLLEKNNSEFDAAVRRMEEFSLAKDYRSATAISKRTIITRPEQSYGRVPFAELCRLFISVYVPGAGLPGARASAFPSPHGSEICPDRAAYSAPAIDTHKAQCRWPWPFPPANTQWHWIPRP